jgi:predicted transposase/invertase (TIGR01784 family)
VNDQWVNLYKKVSEKKLETIKKEVSMSFIETTITELVYNQGLIEGETNCKIDGKVEGKKEMARNLLKMGIDVETITQASGLRKEEIKQLNT